MDHVPRLTCGLSTPPAGPKPALTPTLFGRLGQVGGEPLQLCPPPTFEKRFTIGPILPSVSWNGLLNSFSRNVSTKNSLNWLQKLKGFLKFIQRLASLLEIGPVSRPSFVTSPG